MFGQHWIAANTMICSCIIIIIWKSVNAMQWNFHSILWISKILGVNGLRHFWNIHAFVCVCASFLSCLHNKIRHKTVFIWLLYKLAGFDWDDNVYICERKCKAENILFLLLLLLYFAGSNSHKNHRKMFTFSENCRKINNNNNRKISIRFCYFYKKILL